MNMIPVPAGSYRCKQEKQTVGWGLSCTCVCSIKTGVELKSDVIKVWQSFILITWCNLLLPGIVTQVSICCDFHSELHLVCFCVCADTEVMQQASNMWPKWWPKAVSSFLWEEKDSKTTDYVFQSLTNTTDNTSLTRYRSGVEVTCTYARAWEVRGLSYSKAV